MSDIMMQVGMVSAVIVVAVIIYKLMGDPSYYTAAHEMGHAYAIKYYGGQVHDVVISPHGRSGYTSYVHLASPKHEARVLVAGYVAEEMARGRPVGKVMRGGAYEGDMSLVRDLVGKDSSAEEEAIKAVYAIMSKPGVQEYIKAQAEVLVVKGKIDGASLKVPR